MRISIHIFIAFCVMALATSCRSYDGLIRTYRHAEGAEYHHLNRGAFILARMLTHGEDSQPLKHMHQIRTLDLSDCPEEVRARFTKQVQEYHPKHYEPLVSVNDEDGHTYILARQRRGSIRQLLIISADGDDCLITQIKGRVRLDRISEWIEGANRPRQQLNIVNSPSVW